MDNYPVKTIITYMKNLSKIMQEVVEITTEIETRYPELYKYLDETPFHICKTENKDVCKDDLEEYLLTLKDQLQHHIQTHKK
jgi:hypothetical protein